MTLLLTICNSDVRFSSCVTNPVILGGKIKAQWFSSYCEPGMEANLFLGSLSGAFRDFRDRRGNLTWQLFPQSAPIVSSIPKPPDTGVAFRQAEPCLVSK